MKVFYMGNNWLGWKVLEWLDAQGEEIVGLSVHPSSKQKHGDEILSTADLPDEQVFDARSLEDEEVLSRIRELDPDIGISILFDYILRPPFLDLFDGSVINLHPAYLPYNRGQYPNVWSIVEGTPAGTTLHYIDPEIDTGDIIARKGVNVESVDTGKTLYRKLEQASFELFKDTWPAIASGRVSRVEQKREEGTYHRSDDVEEIDKIDLDASYKARDLINILRARTFPPHESAYFEEDGKKVYISVNLEYEQQE
jgi:methionyl-tRNA formyltransferase